MLLDMYKFMQVKQAMKLYRRRSWRDLREVFQNFIILLAEQIPLKWILIKSLITNQTET